MTLLYWASVGGITLFLWSLQSKLGNTTPRCFLDLASILSLGIPLLSNGHWILNPYGLHNLQFVFPLDGESLFFIGLYAYTWIHVVGFALFVVNQKFKQGVWHHAHLWPAIVYSVLRKDAFPGQLALSLMYFDVAILLLQWKPGKRYNLFVFGLVRVLLYGVFLSLNVVDFAIFLLPWIAQLYLGYHYIIE